MAIFMSWNILRLSSFLFVLTLATTVLAQGGPPCNERDTFLELLSRKYSETPTSGGVTLSGGLVEVLTSPENETWSIVVTSPNGITCLVAAGEGWRKLHKKETGPET